ICSWAARLGLGDRTGLRGGGDAGVRQVLDEISAPRPGLCELATDSTLLCRCEEVTTGEVRAAIAEGARNLQAVKLLTRLGMGACQGRNCAPSTAPPLSGAPGQLPPDAGRGNPPPPGQPARRGMLAGRKEEA